MTRLQLEALLITKIRSAGSGGLTTADDVRQFCTEIIDTIFDNYDASNLLISDGLALKVAKAGAETITGVKTFSVLPESAVNPTTANQLVRKAWVESLVAGIVLGDIAFDSNKLIKRQVTGLSGINLNKATLIDTLNELLFPLIAPSIITTQDSESHEYGDTTNISVSYTATKTDNTITSIIVGGFSIAPTGLTQSGTQNIAKTAAANNVITSTSSDGVRTSTVTLTNFVKHKVRIGDTAKDGTIAPILDADINALTGVFQDSRLYAGIIVIPSSRYLIIELPTSFGTPRFHINSVYVNSFTKVRNSSAFINAFAYSTNVDVWVSNNFMSGTIYLNIL